MKFALTSIAVALALVGCASNNSSTTPAISAPSSVLSSTVIGSVDPNDPNLSDTNPVNTPNNGTSTSTATGTGGNNGASPTPTAPTKNPPDFSVDTLTKEKEEELAKNSALFGVSYLPQSNVNEAIAHNLKVDAGPPEGANEATQKTWPKTKKNAGRINTKSDNTNNTYTLDSFKVNREGAQLDINLVIGAGQNGITPVTGQGVKAIDKDSDGIQKYVFEDLKFARYGYAADPYNPDISKGGLFALGQVTPVSQIPLKGTATYAGQALYRTDTRNINHQGNSEFTADFFHKELTGKVTAGKYSKELFAHINGNRFEYTPSPSEIETRAAVSGMFFGENYAELAGVFHDVGQKASGSFGAKRTDNATNTGTSANTGTTPKP